LLSVDSFFGFPSFHAFIVTLVPSRFDRVDFVFAIVTLFLIVKFVNSLRPILGD
jgi:hypothetical protein